MKKVPLVRARGHGTARWARLRRLEPGEVEDAAPGRYLVIAKSAADYTAMRGQVQATGANEVLAMPAINTVVVVADLGAVSALKSNSHVKIVAPDRVEHLIRPGMQPEFFGPQGRTRYKVSKVGAAVKVTPDPAYFLDGLMWNLKRIDAKEAWSEDDRFAGRPGRRCRHGSRLHAHRAEQPGRGRRGLHDDGEPGHLLSVRRGARTAARGARG